MLTRYFNFLTTSQNQHGLHSPFVYALVTECFYDKTPYPEYQVLKNYRQELLQDKRTIEVTDFGAGSKVFKSNTRQVAKIAKNVGIFHKRAKLLFRITKYLQAENILELGTSLGLATAALALPENTKVITFEGCPQTAGIAKEKLRQFGLNNVQLRIGEFSQELEKHLQQTTPRYNKQPATGNRQQATNNKPQTTNNREQTTDNRQQATGNRQQTTGNRQQTTGNRHQTTDLIYFDGNHTKAATLEYFEKLLPTAHNDTLFIFDDIHWSREMEEAWGIIKSHPKVRVTIDSFYLGFVFFRKEQVKQHFKIRL
ncbi:class I SAM-dependent methyltransferase [Salegentibacter sp. HM20]